MDENHTDQKLFHYFFHYIIISFLTFILIASIIAIIIYEPYAVNGQEQFSTYENSTYNIRTQYPSDWDVESGDNSPDDTTIDVVIFSSPNVDDFATIDIFVDELDDSETLDQYLGDSISGYQHDLNGFNIVESNTHNTLAGLPAYKLLYTFNEDDDNLKDMEIGTIVGDKAYYIQYENDPEQFDTDLPVVQKIIDSFEIIKK